jgi:hypothetical protein
MTIESEKQEILARSVRLLAWWIALGENGATGTTTSLAAVRNLVMEARSALQSANSAQVRALSALTEELPGLLLQAAKTRDPQALLEAQLEIAARVQRSGAECARAWADFAWQARRWGATPPVATVPAEHTAGASVRKSTAIEEASHA